MRLPLVLTCLAALAACAPAQDPVAQAALGAPRGAQYLGIDTRLLDGPLVSFVVHMRGARGRTDAVTYARCAAAQYTLIRGYTFARHVRTTVTQQGDIWVADGVYTISPDLPLGARNIDAEVIVEDCREQGIPTV
ncbi:MAG: hypothetical protein ACK4HW_03110 [Roseinatronobacter sp.]